jgi:outer membrane protein
MRSSGPQASAIEFEGPGLRPCRRRAGDLRASLAGVERGGGGNSRPGGFGNERADAGPSTTPGRDSYDSAAKLLDKVVISVKSLLKPTLAGIAVALAMAFAPAAWAEVKIGYVDYGRLMEESPQAKAALEAIRTEFAPRQRELQNEQTSLKSKEEKLQKDGATMTPDQRSRAEKDLRDGARDFARKQGEVQDDFNARRNEETSRLQRVLIEEVRNYAKAQNFDLIIAENVIYATATVDITPAILSALQARAPKTASAPANGAVPATTKPPSR